MATMLKKEQLINIVMMLVDRELTYKGIDKNEFRSNCENSTEEELVRYAKQKAAENVQSMVTRIGCVLPEGYETIKEQRIVFIVKKDSTKTLIQILPVVEIDEEKGSVQEYYKIRRIGNYIPFNDRCALKLGDTNLGAFVESVLVALEQG